jgi:hypothetical protein
MASEKQSAHENEKKWTEVVARAWSDEDFKKRLLAEPVAVLKEAGCGVPKGLQLKVVENTERLVHFILPPPAPPVGEPIAEAQALLGGWPVRCSVGGLDDAWIAWGAERREPVGTRERDRGSVS